MADVKIQIYGIRTVEDARMVIDMGAHHIGVSYIFQRFSKKRRESRRFGI